MRRKIFFDRLLLKKIFYKNDNLEINKLAVNNSQINESVKFKKLNFYSKKLKAFFLKKTSLIVSTFVGERIYIYLGKEFLSLKIKENMINYKLGELFFLRSRRKSIKQKKKK